MLSIILLIALFIAVLLLQAAVMTLAARAVRAERATFRAGVKASLVTMLINMALAVGVMIALPPQRQSAAALSLTLYAAAFLAQCVLTLVVCTRVFRPNPPVKAFAPFVAYLVFAGVCWLAMDLAYKPYVGESFLMPAAGMSPALEPGDRFYVNRLLTPRRWDVVAYWSVGNDFDTGEPMLFAKRLVGMPGEKLRFAEGQVYINDHLVTPPEHMVGKYTTVLPGVDGPYEDGQTITLGSDEFFLIGDPVDRSVDSQLEGPSRRQDIVGVVDLRYWPPDRIGILGGATSNYVRSER